MEALIFSILIIQLIIIMVLSVLNFKEQLLNFYLGIRRKRAIFLDLRQAKTVTLSLDYKTFEAYNKVFVWNFAKEVNNACFYRSDNSEALEAELVPEKCQYWCNSNEYHTNLKNKLLETLMMLRSKDTIIMLLIICLIIGSITLMLVWIKTGSISDSLEVVKTGITALNNSQIQTTQPGG